MTGDKTDATFSHYHLWFLVWGINISKALCVLIVSDSSLSFSPEPSLIRLISLLHWNNSWWGSQWPPLLGSTASFQNSSYLNYHHLTQLITFSSFKYFLTWLKRAHLSLPLFSLAVPFPSPLLVPPHLPDSSSLETPKFSSQTFSLFTFTLLMNLPSFVASNCRLKCQGMPNFYLQSKYFFL